MRAAKEALQADGYGGSFTNYFDQRELEIIRQELDLKRQEMDLKRQELEREIENQRRLKELEEEIVDAQLSRDREQLHDALKSVFTEEDCLSDVKRHIGLPVARDPALLQPLFAVGGALHKYENELAHVESVLRPFSEQSVAFTAIPLMLNFHLYADGYDALIKYQERAKLLAWDPAVKKLCDALDRAFKDKGFVYVGGSAGKGKSRWHLLCSVPYRTKKMFITYWRPNRHIQPNPFTSLSKQFHSLFKLRRSKIKRACLKCRD